MNDANVRMSGLAPILDDYDIIEAKVKEIKSQYEEHEINSIKIDVVAHSRGVHLVEMAHGINHDDIGKFIKIGSVSNRKNLENKAHEIIGKQDVVVQDEPSLLPEQTKKVNTGHLGLIYSSETHQHVVSILYPT